MEDKPAMEASTGDLLRSRAEQILASGALGKSFQINRLFKYLVERSAAGESPKEIELAQAVFGLDASASSSSDATVRATVHRLRRKLAELPGDANGDRLVLNRGEYRLVLVSANDGAGTQAGGGGIIEGSPWSAPRKRLVLLAAAAILVLTAAIWFAQRHSDKDPAHSPIWLTLARAQFPTLVVTGDSYIFGELNRDGRLLRMVRDPRINSAEALASTKYALSSDASATVDLNYHVLPEAMGAAINAIAPIAHASSREGAGSIGASRFVNDMMTKYNIVYVGLLDGLSELRAPLFYGSRFHVSEDGTEMLDRENGQRFRSDWDDPSKERLLRRDYAYIASRRGPIGNRMIVIAGIRDPGLVEASLIASNRNKLDQLAKRVGGDAFEAIYEVRTFGPSNYNSRLILARRMVDGEKFRINVR